VEDKAAGKIVVTVVASKNGKCLIRVRDNGPGFPPRQLQTPFVPYSTTKPDGMGLGLAKTNNIIDAFQGTIALANIPQGGALVTVTLPISQGPAALDKAEATDLRQILSKAHNAARLEKSTKSVDLTLETPDAPIMVSGDPQSLSDAMVKLYLAAAAASASAPPGHPRTLTVTLAPSDSGGAEISFVHNGPSPDPGDPAFSQVFKGPASAKSVIEAHRGSLALERAQGGENLILVSLPKSPL
jgi:C4-dicarboxylate-specific signal transduction histidine kinase